MKNKLIHASPRIISIIMLIATLASTLTFLTLGTSAASVYYPKASSKSGSIVEVLKSVGETDTSYTHRKAIAEANGIKPYSGTAAQNGEMVSLCRSGALKKCAKHSVNTTTNNTNTNNTSSAPSNSSVFEKVEKTVTNSINSIQIKTSGKYIVKDKAVMRSSTGWAYSKYATLTKNSIVEVSGSKGDFYTIKLTEGSKTKTVYIKKSELKQAGENYTASFCYVTKENAPLRSAPYEEGKRIASLKKGELLYVLGKARNSYFNDFMIVQRADGTYGYIYSENVKSTSKITISITGNTSLMVGNNTTFMATVTPSGISGLTWTSSNTKIATVDNNGNIKTFGGGDVNITASIGPLSVSLTPHIRLAITSTLFQQTNYTCSSSSALNVIRYFGKGQNLDDVSLYNSTDGYVYKTTNTINQYIGNKYKYGIFNDFSSYISTIKKSLENNAPIVARVKIATDGFFAYSSGGHYCVIIDCFIEDGRYWLLVADSFANRYASTTFSDCKTGLVKIPADTMFKYGNYNGTSDVYLIYRP